MARIMVHFEVPVTPSPMHGLMMAQFDAGLLDSMCCIATKHPGFVILQSGAQDLFCLP
jgi:hypothetical protein